MKEANKYFQILKKEITIFASQIQRSFYYQKRSFSFLNLKEEFEKKEGFEKEINLPDFYIRSCYDHDQFISNFKTKITYGFYPEI